MPNVHQREHRNEQHGDRRLRVSFNVATRGKRGKRADVAATARSDRGSSRTRRRWRRWRRRIRHERRPARKERGDGPKAGASTTYSRRRAGARSQLRVRGGAGERDRPRQPTPRPSSSRRRWTGHDAGVKDAAADDVGEDDPAASKVPRRRSRTGGAPACPRRTRRREQAAELSIRAPSGTQGTSQVNILSNICSWTAKVKSSQIRLCQLGQLGDTDHSAALSPGVSDVK